MLIKDMCEDLRNCHVDFALESIGKIKEMTESILEEYEKVLEIICPGDELYEFPESMDIRDQVREELEEVKVIYIDLKKELEEA